MRRILAALVALAVVGVFAPAAQARTVDELRPLALTAGDLGAGFQLVPIPASGPNGEALPGHAGVYYKMGGLLDPSLTIVANGLADAALTQGTDLDPTAALALLLQEGITATPVEAPAIGQETFRYRLDGTLRGLTVTGDLVGWRHQDVLATVAVLRAGLPGTAPSGDAPAVVDLALLQQERLVRALGE